MMPRTLLAAAVATLLGSSVSSAAVTKPFAGVTLVDDGDRAMVIADLCSPGVSVRATRYDERKATPQQWATKPTVNAVAAINADFFDFPGWTYVIGRGRGDGQDWPAADQNRENRNYWQFGPAIAENVAAGSIAPKPGVTEIVGGHNIIILNGKSRAPNFDGDAVILGTFRRTGIGMNAAHTKLYLFASTTPMSGATMATSMLALAAEGGAPDLDTASNQDGGGSSQLYVKGQGQIIDSGRQVNNHLGIIANGSGPSPMCTLPPARPDGGAPPARPDGGAVVPGDAGGVGSTSGGDGGATSTGDGATADGEGADGCTVSASPSSLRGALAALAVAAAVLLRRRVRRSR